MMVGTGETIPLIRPSVSHLIYHFVLSYSNGKQGASVTRRRSRSRFIKKLAHFECIIIDDLGYVQQSREEMEVLFTLLAERYERGSLEHRLAGVRFRRHAIQLDSRRCIALQECNDSKFSTDPSDPKLIMLASAT
jgi:IstB-like ATP binding protein